MYLVIDSEQKRFRVIEQIQVLSPAIKWVVDIREYSPSKTNEQCAKWHAMRDEIAEYTGYSKKEMKAILKRELLEPTKVEYAGKTYLMLPSISSMKKAELSELIEHTYRWCVERGIPVT